MMRYILIVILLSLTPSKASALMLSEAGAFRLDEHLHYIEDRYGEYDQEHIRSADLKWRKNVGGIFNKGFSASAWWLKFSATNPTDQIQQRLLEVSYPVLDRVEIFIYANDHMISHSRFGDKYPYAMRTIDHHHFLQPLNWQARQTLDVYIRVTSYGIINVPLTLWKRDAFLGFDGRRTFGMSLFYGALGVFVFYNLLLFLAVKDRSYLYFVISEGSGLLFLASFMGLAFRYLWPDSTTWNDRAIPFFISIASVFGILFFKRILRLDEISRNWCRLALNLAAIGCVCAGTVFITSHHTALRLAMCYSTVMICTSFIVGIFFWQHGVSTAWLLTAAMTAILIGFIPMTFIAVDLIHPNTITQYAPYIGTILGALLLSFALTERINVDRRLRHQAQESALAATTRANTELEEIISERTREKQALNERLRLLSHTDQLTGIKNRRYLDQYLSEECMRCRQKQRSMAVVIADIDFFKKINDTYGHAAGDVCLSEVARRIAACVMRPGDEVARFGGEEFCVILPEIDIKGARTVAERIRKSIECLPVRYEDNDINVTISAGVASMAPALGSGPEEILKSADLALYAAKQTGRNRVCTYPSASSDRAV